MKPGASGRAPSRFSSGPCCRPDIMTDAPPERAPPDRPPSDALWDGLRRLTAARIGLARTGASLTTGPLLDLRLAHSRAREPVIGSGKMKRGFLPSLPS